MLASEVKAFEITEETAVKGDLHGSATGSMALGASGANFRLSHDSGAGQLKVMQSPEISTFQGADAVRKQLSKIDTKAQQRTLENKTDLIV